MANRSQLGAVAVIALAGIAGQVRAASVTIVATSNIGDRLMPEIRLYQGGSRTNVWPAAHIQTADIPHGYYNIEVFQPGFRRFSRELEIGDEHVDVRVVLTPSVEITGALELEGRISGAGDYDGLWVLVFPLAGNPSDATEGKISDVGRFRILTAHGGPYLLAVVRGDRVLHTRQVYIRPQNPEVTIDLAQTK